MNDTPKTQRTRLEWIWFFVAKYEHHLSVAAFLAGFLLDNFALPPIDHPIAHIILALYLVLAAGGIVLVQAIEARHQDIGFFSRMLPFLPPLIQFIFGGLFSSLFVFYARSASLSGTWPFMILLVVMIVGNEVLRDRYARLEFQVSVLFMTLFGFMIFYLPILLSRLDALTFLMSGVASLLIITLFGIGLYLVAPHATRRGAPITIPAIGGIFILLNLLYFTNSIPPIPLALRSAGVYHFIVRDEAGDYVGRAEQMSWYEQYLAFSPAYHYTPNESIYFYSAVFAPTAFNIPIVHEWRYFNESEGEWETKMRVSFPVFGGRANGYRSYSTKSAIVPGRWQVLVKTEQGALLGKTAFMVTFTSSPTPLEEKVL